MYPASDVTPVARPWVRQPVSDLVVRSIVVTAPLALGTIAALLGLHFQRESASARRGEPLDFLRYRDPIKSLLASMGVIGVVTLAALAIWSFIVVGNAKRVFHSLRAPWFAAAGWLIAPGLGLLAHSTLDARLHSGSLVGCTVFLAVLYIPFGTLGGASKDLGDSFHLARMWFLSAGVSAFLLIVGITGATDGLPDSDVANRMRLRSVACYLAALMLAACSALAFATARNLQAYISHKWLSEVDPERAEQLQKARVTRAGRLLKRRMTPTLFLRVAVSAGLLVTGGWLAVEVFVKRARALDLGDIGDVATAHLVLDQLRTTAMRVGIVAVAVHAVFVVWATVASRNAYRRSIMAPTPWAVVAAFLGGPAIIAAGIGLGGPFGDAVLAVGIALAIGGFIVGQLVLGRTVSEMGGRGRIFLIWVIVDIGAVLIGLFVSTHTAPRLQLMVDGIAQVGITLLNATLGWFAMTRLDRTCRAFRHAHNHPEDNAPPPTAPQFIPSQALAPLTLTSSQS
jgi:hypothetical protein